MLYKVDCKSAWQRLCFLRSIAAWFKTQDMESDYIREHAKQKGVSSPLVIRPCSDAHLRLVLGAVEDRVKELYAAEDALDRYAKGSDTSSIASVIRRHRIEGELILFAVKLGESFASGGNDGKRKDD